MGLLLKFVRAADFQDLEVAVGQIVPKHDRIAAKEMDCEFSSGGVAFLKILKTVRCICDLVESMPNALPRRDR